MCAFIDHGPDGTGEAVTMLLCAANSGANTAADHKLVLAQALSQLSWNPSWRVGRRCWCAPTPAAEPTSS